MSQIAFTLFARYGRKHIVIRQLPPTHSLYKSDPEILEVSIYSDLPGISASLTPKDIGLEFGKLKKGLHGYYLTKSQLFALRDALAKLANKGALNGDPDHEWIATTNYEVLESVS